MEIVQDENAKTNEKSKKKKKSLINPELWSEDVLYNNIFYNRLKLGKIS